MLQFHILHEAMKKRFLQQTSSQKDCDMIKASLVF